MALFVLSAKGGAPRELSAAVAGEGKLAWSPDSRRLAFMASANRRGYDIHVINADGTNPHVLLPKHESYYYFLIADWSSDGRQLLVQSFGQQGVQLSLVSIADGSIRVLKSLGSEYTALAAFSSDDRYVAYTHPSRQGSKDSDIYAISVADGRELRLLSGPSDDRLMRTGRVDVHIEELDDAGPIGLRWEVTQA